MSQASRFKNVLVVDDDQVHIHLMRGVLEKNGFDVTTTDSAPDGLQMALDTKPDLIFLDVMMPIINGFNFCKMVKAEIKDKEPRIVMVTARDRMDDIQIGLDSGADAYLTKPIDTEELIKTIRVVESMT